MRYLMVFCASTLLLTACGSSNTPSTGTQSSSSSSSVVSSSSSSSVSSSSAVAIDYDTLKVTPQTDQALVRVSEATLLEQVKNGIRLQLKNGQIYYLEDGLDFSPRPPEAEPVTSGGDRFSETNVHVAGVDEADYAKYDGTHWYVARYPQYSSGGSVSAGMQIVATNPDSAQLDIIGEVTFDAENEWGSAAEMYLVQQDESTTHVATLRNQWGDVGIDLIGSPNTNADFWFWPGPQNSQTRLQLFNVETPSAPVIDGDIKIEGSLIQSKKIDNTLYLITRYDPWLNGLVHEYGDEEVRSANEALLAAATADDLLPKYQIGETTGLLTNTCLLQAGVDTDNGFNSLVYVTTVNLESKTIIASECLNSGVDILHMSNNALYLTGTIYDETWNGSQTVIHKFNLENTGPAYTATGSVSGYLWGGGDSEFRLNEYQGDLRVVTTQWEDGIEHKLFILEENQGLLKTVATLPNENNPAPIGKPNEQIYSVRFNGSSAYIVTFLQTDPLYTLDLSDRLNPVIQGEVEMPGFASYLHPIDENYIFSVGRNANENGQTQGIKAELIDVSADDPVVVNTILLGSRYSYSEALYNLHALSFLRLTDDQLRIAMPIQRYADTADLDSFWWSSYDWLYNGLQLFEVNGLSGNDASLSDAGVIVAESAELGHNEYGYGYGVDRSVLHDDAVFFAHNNAFWVADWTAPEHAVGPIAADGIACTEDYRFGLAVSVELEFVNDMNACDAVVTLTDGDYRETLEGDTPDSDGVCRMYGAGERAGTYVIETSLAGFTTSVKTVQVAEDVCHVIPREVNVVLTRIED